MLHRPRELMRTYDTERSQAILGQALFDLFKSLDLSDCRLLWRKKKKNFGRNVSIPDVRYALESS